MSTHRFSIQWLYCDVDRHHTHSLRHKHHRRKPKPPQPKRIPFCRSTASARRFPIPQRHYARVYTASRPHTPLRVHSLESARHVFHAARIRNSIATPRCRQSGQPPARVGEISSFPIRRIGLSDRPAWKKTAFVHRETHFSRGRIVKTKVKKDFQFHAPPGA